MIECSLLGMIYSKVISRLSKIIQGHLFIKFFMSRLARNCENMEMNHEDMPIYAVHFRMLALWAP